MSRINKDNDYIEIYNKISEILSVLDNKKALSIIADILSDYDLTALSNMAREDYDPCIAKNCLDYFDEGNEDCGFINLSHIISEYENILNCDDSTGDIKIIKKALRIETKEEMEEEGHNDGIEWLTEDTSINIKKIILGFEQ